METKTFIAIDFETADYKADSACAIGMARIENMEIVKTFEALIRPPREHIIFTYIHGITWEDVMYEKSFAEVWEEAQDFIQGAEGFIAHNASFDRKVLTECCIQGRKVPPYLPFYCTLKASRKFLKLPSHKLNNVAEHFGIELQHHNAMSDTLACGQIFINLHNLGYNVEEGKIK